MVRKFLLLLVVAIAVYYSNLSQDGSSPPAPTEEKRPLGHFYHLTNNITILQSDPETNFQNSFDITTKTPLLIRNAFPTKWLALERWEPAYIHQKSRQSLFDVKIQNFDRVFRYRSSDGLLDPTPKDQSRKWPKVTRMTIQQFWDAVKKNQTVYFSTSLDYFDREILKDVPGMDNLKFSPEATSSRFIWMGGRCVTTQTHYDESHNFFTQIRG